VSFAYAFCFATASDFYIKLHHAKLSSDRQHETTIVGERKDRVHVSAVLVGIQVYKLPQAEMDGDDEVSSRLSDPARGPACRRPTVRRVKMRLEVANQNEFPSAEIPRIERPLISE